MPSLNLTLKYPIISGNDTDSFALIYSTFSQNLLVSSRPVTIVLYDGAPTAIISDGRLEMALPLTTKGTVIPDFQYFRVMGMVRLGTTDYSGTLLSGSITEFGWKELDGTDRFEFIVELNNDSLLKGFYPTTVNLIITAEASTFKGVFTQAFNSRAKFMLGGGSV